MFYLYFFFSMDDYLIHLWLATSFFLGLRFVHYIRIVAYLHPKGLKDYMVIYTAFMLPILPEAANSDLHIIMNTS